MKIACNVISRIGDIFFLQGKIQDCYMKAICLSNMASVSTESGVQFAPYSSAVDAAFWHRLTQNKLEIYQLDDKPQPLQGYYVNSEYGSIRE